MDNCICKGTEDYPFCSFAFKWHVLRTIGSQRTGAEFKCRGYCRFEDCSVSVTITMDNARDHKAKVHFSGSQSVHNRFELKQRPVQANDRTQYGKDLQKRLPRSVYLDKLNAIPEKVFESGCRDEVPSPRFKKRNKRNETKNCIIMK